MGWTLFVKNRLAVISAIALLWISLMAIFAPSFTHFSYEEQNIAERLQSPSHLHWMGTDALGRDLYSRIVYGARLSMAIGLVTTFFSLILGTWVGAIAGYFGKTIDLILMRIVDMIYIFPSVLLAVLLTLIFGRGLTGIMVAIGITSWMTQARLVRGLVLQTRELPYIEAARAIGHSHISILLKHILPNIAGPVIISLTIQIPTNIMAESFLSFIGLGLQPPYSSWGTLSNEGFRAMQSYPHLILFPGIILFFTMMAFNYLGDGLQNSLDASRNDQLTH